MSTSRSVIIASGARASVPGARRAPGARLWAVALIILVAVMLQISVMPFIRVAGGMPDVLVGAVVAVALLRGSLVGVVAGAAGGLLVELTSPVGTLGALGLIYLAIGWGAGRLCGRDEFDGLLGALAVCIAGEIVVQFGEAFVQVMFARSLDPGDVLRATLASVILTALVSVPVVAIVRRILGEPVTVEPFALSGDA